MTLISGHYRRVLRYSPIAFTALFGIMLLDSFQVGSYTDDAWYIATATALADGLGFVRPWTPNLVPETFLAPGYPALLAPLRMLFPHSFLPLQLLSLSAVVGTVFLSISVYCQGLEWPMGWLAALLLATHAYLVGSGIMVMSDAVYMFVSVLTIVLIKQRRSGIVWGLLVGMMVTGAYFVRAWGLTLVGGAVGFFLLKRRWKEALGILCVFGISYGLWFARNTALGGEGSSYGLTMRTILANLRGQRLDLPNDVYVQKLSLDAQTAMSHWLRDLPNILVPLIFGPRVLGFLESLKIGFLSTMAGIAVVVVVFIGYLTQLQKQVTVSEIYVLAYAPLITLSPAEGGERYWLPLVPFLLHYLVLGLQAIASRLPSPDGGVRLARTAVKAAVIALIALHLFRNVQGLTNPLRDRIPDISLGTAWIAENTPTDSVIMAQIPRVAWLYSQRTVVPFPGGGGEVYNPYAALVASETKDRLFAAIATYNVSYILVEPKLVPEKPFKWSEYTEREVIPILEHENDHFELVYSSHDNLTRVYRVRME